MTDRNRELVVGSWGLVGERALTTGFSAEGVAEVCTGEERLKGEWDLIINYFKPEQ